MRFAILTLHYWDLVPLQIFLPLLLLSSCHLHHHKKIRLALLQVGLALLFLPYYFELFLKLYLAETLFHKLERKKTRFIRCFKVKNKETRTLLLAKCTSRSSRSNFFHKIAVLKYIANLIRRHFQWSLFIWKSCRFHICNFAEKKNSLAVVFL